MRLGAHGTPSTPADRRSRRTLPLALAVVIAIVLLAAQNSVVSIQSYRLVDQRTIALTVGVAPCSWTRVTSVTETSIDVRVMVETLPCPIPGASTGILDARELTIALRNDLGDRTVEDATGQRVLRRPAPG
jgi:hypothetical protein